MRAITGSIDPGLVRSVLDAIAKVRPDVLHLEGGGLAALLRSTAQQWPAASLRARLEGAALSGVRRLLCAGRANLGSGCCRRWRGGMSVDGLEMRIESW